MIARGVVLATGCAMVAFAVADVKITAEVTVTGIGDAAKTEMVTTCYKGHLIRTERSSTVSIYDTVNQTVTTIRKSDKTYRVMDLKKNLTGMPNTLAKLSLNTTANVQAMTGTETIAGLPCKKYEGEATIQMMSATVPGQSLPTTRIQIEQWMTEKIDSAKGTDAFMPLQQFIGPLKIYQGMEPLLREFSKMKGLPLSSRITVSVDNGQMKNPIVTTTNVKSVSEAPLEDTLFQVPKGYALAQLRTPEKIPAKQQP